MRTPTLAALFGGLFAVGAAVAEPAKTEVTTKIASVSGSVEKPHVTNALRSIESKLLACYDSAPVKDRPSTAQTTVTFTIGADGAIAKSSAKGTTFDGCLATALKTMKFDKLASGKPADVVVHLTFAPRRAGAFDSLQGGSASGASGLGDAGSGSATQAVPGGMTGLGLGSGGGTIGIGRIGTVSQSSGIGQGYGGPSSKPPKVTFGTPSCGGGGLDPAIVRRVLRRYAQHFTYCYEKQLLANAKLAGKLVTKFDIDSEGKVTNASAAGIDSEVESCVVRMLSRVDFPKPKAGAHVTVTYPMTFDPPPATPSKQK
jgi:hypothetical protein